MMIIPLQSHYFKDSRSSDNNPSAATLVRPSTVVLDFTQKLFNDLFSSLEGLFKM